MDTARFILFAIVTGIATVAAHVYLYRRLFADTSTSPKWRRVGMGLMTALAVPLILSWSVTRFIPMDSTFAVATAVWTWMGMSIYLLLSLWVLGGARRVAARLSRSRQESNTSVSSLSTEAASRADAASSGAQARSSLAPTGTDVIAADAASAGARSHLSLVETGPEVVARPINAGSAAMESWARSATGTDAVAPASAAMAAAAQSSHGAPSPQSPMASAAAGAQPSAPVDAERRRFLARMTAGGAVLASGSVTGFGMWSAFHPPVVNEVAVKLPGLPKALDGFTIVHLSDIHVGPVIRRRFMDELVRRCNALRPDLMCITGDLVDGHVETLSPAVSALSELKSRHGTYFVTGNHEYYWNDAAWADALERMGVHVLRNRHVRIGDAAASFDLLGVDDWSAKKTGFRQSYDLGAAMAGRDAERASVLLAHQPSNWKVAAREGVGLQLSGHTHGGQFFPFTLAVSAIWEHDAGLFHEGERHLYVSRGTGFWGPPLRVGAPPEIVRVTLLA
ncbi:metallophosphoesterase [Myxococcus sp. Y35]|uniref:metallophosphoesterase n=1 Tax=Pseudomyxococcus flavus TaxID=3115648 RepID=UPI003CEB5805